MTKKPSGVNKTVKGILTALLLWGLLFSLRNDHPASAAATQDKPNAAEPKEEDSVRNLIEELYVHYEAIDRRLRELKGHLRATGDVRDLLTPATVYVKKEKGFRLISVELKDNGASLWYHIYTADENEALD